MPKKFEGQNSKAMAAKARKAAVVETKLAREQKQLEDMQWIENDKHILKKQQRKQTQECKRLEAINKKAQTKALLEKESASLKINKVSNTKITRTQIQNNLQKSQTKLNRDTKMESDVLHENINGQISEYEAKNIDEAIALLSLQEQSVEKHPEKRLKAAYNAFEEKRLKELKIENPTLRLSQVKQMLFKEWQKNVKSYLNKN